MNVIVWFRRDLRLADNPALAAALEAGNVIPVFIWAPEEEAPWQPGAASRAWLHHSLEAFSAELEALGSRLIIRQGESLAVLQELIKETGAKAVHWNRLYEPAIVERDKGIKSALKNSGINACSHNGALLFEPWTVATQQDKPYQVYTPYWKNCAARLGAIQVIDTPKKLNKADDKLHSEPLADLALTPKLGWDAEFWKHWTPGSQAAMKRLDEFVEISLNGYDDDRNRPDVQGTSRLSPHLHFGEISPGQIIHAIRGIETEAATRYRQELVWREFAHHLLWHFPHTTTQPLRDKFTEFAWRDSPSDLKAWQQGNTGIPLVDAGMRELWRTGYMHNRVRMVVGSLLTKNLLISWQEGAAWFWDTLVDASLANNTLGWQWIGGCGADAQPFFRIFNPVSQQEKFDPRMRYCKRWIPELGTGDYPREPIVDLKASRARALEAWEQVR